MNRIFIGLWVVVVLSLSAGCGSRGVRGTITEMMATPIAFPAGMQARVLKRDTTIDRDVSEPYKFVAYLNSTQCDGCRLKELLMWKYLLRQLDSLRAWDSVRLVFIFHPKDTAELVERLVLYDFDRPIWVDREGCFERANPHLPEDPIFHTFLLDRENRVVLVGSPVGNPKMWELYRKTIDRLVGGGNQ